MPKFTLTIVYVLVLTICFIIDKAFAGVFVFFEVFSFVNFILLMIMNKHQDKVKIILFLLFFYGLLCDWYLKSFVGIRSLLLILLLFGFIVVKVRVAGNRISMFILNTIVSYIFCLISFPYEGVLSLETLLFSLLSSLALGLLNSLR